ncbi:MAG: hypothetical protein ABFC38_14330 [Methanospirillum sp.]
MNDKDSKQETKYDSRLMKLSVTDRARAIGIIAAYALPDADKDHPWVPDYVVEICKEAMLESSREGEPEGTAALWNAFDRVVDCNGSNPKTVSTYLFAVIDLIKSGE